MSHIINPFRFGGGGVQPDDIAGLFQWLEADAITGLNDGDNIATWEDSSGNNRDATGATSGGGTPTYQTNELNSLPVVRFSPAFGQRFTLGDFSALTEGEAFIVVKLVSNTPPEESNGLWAMGTSTGVAFPYTDDNIYEGFGSSGTHSVNPTPTLAAWRIYNVFAAANDYGINLDGSSIYTSGSNTVAFPASAMLGLTPGNNRFLDGDVAEFIFYDNKLDAGDRSDVLTYIQNKYAL